MTIKVATYNIEFGKRLEQISDNIKALADSGVSLFCLQEVCQIENTPPLVKTILDKLGNGWQIEIFDRPNTHDLGDALLWDSRVLQIRSDINNVERTFLPKLEKLNLLESFWEKKIIKIIDGPLQKGSITATFSIKGRPEPIRVTSMHLDWHGRFSQREKQLAHLASRLNQIMPRTDYEIIAGDFNVTGPFWLSRKQERKLLALLGPGFTNAHPRLKPTQVYLQRLDYIFSRGGEITGAEVVKLNGSDHYPVVAEWKL